MLDPAPGVHRTQLKRGCVLVWVMPKQTQGHAGAVKAARVTYTLEGLSMPQTAQGAKPRMITIPQAAELYQVGERTLRRYIAEGNLVAYRLGRSIRLRPEDVDNLFTRTDAWAGGER